MSVLPLRRLAWLVLGWTVAVILWGAFVRATGSGAGCGAHWPLCNGEVLPRPHAIETVIEFTHRATSGVALLLVALLAVRVFRERAKGHPARRAVTAAVVFIVTEAAVGAGLVLLRLVADNESVARAVWMAGHLVNTFLLLAALTLSMHWIGTDAPLRRDAVSRHGWVFGLGLLGILLVGTSGAVAALGDTLYPARSLLGGLAQDLSPTAHFLVQLRVAHPFLALAGVLVLAVVCARALRSADDPSVRRTAWTLAGLSLAQVGLGVLNLALLAPIWLQLAHLLLADALWIVLVLLAARVLSRPPFSRSELAAA
jgi:heme A synthase